MNRFKTLKDHVCDYIAEQIRDGSLLPGDRINENNICLALDISRTPVREALIQLAAEGIIESAPRRGFIIKSISRQETLELYAVIGALDATAARLACDKLTEHDFADMSFYVDSIRLAIESKNFEMYQKQQVAFHDIYIQKCGNATLISLLETSKKKFMSRTYANYPEGNGNEILSTINDGHSVILELLKKKDADGVAKYIADTHWRPRYTDNDMIL